MSDDLFFLQPIPQLQSCGNQRDKIGTTSLDRSSKPATTELSPQCDGENFLTTLIDLSQNRFAQNGSTDAGWPGASKSSIDLISANDEDTGSFQMPADRNLPEFFKMLEKMGFHDDSDGSDWQKMVAATAVDGDDLVALQMLIVGFQQNRLAPTTELKAGFERLRQFISGTQVAKTLAAIDGNPVKGFNSNQVSNPAQIDQILTNIDSGAQNPKTEAGVSPGADGSDEKTSEPISTGTRITADLVGKSADRVDKATDLTINIRNDETNQIKANSVVVSQSAIRGDFNATQLTTENRPLDLENNLTTKVPDSIDKADADAKQPKEALSFLRDTRNSDRSEFSNRIPQAADYEKQNGTETMRDNPSLKQGTPSGMNPNPGKFSESSLQSVAGGEPQSRVFQETQPAKEGIKVEPAMVGETSSKVIKTEAGTNENGMLNSPSQNTDKSAETAASSKETETGQSSLRTQTMDQIVRRAVIQLRNGGQPEARIDLKPEFLGHIRMQVVSENQQVTVKILAEYGFVKDMIENNAHQLKADLQQHGLEIDKLEVSVSRDSNDSGSPRENLAESKAKQGAAGQNNPERPAKEKSKDRRQSAQTTDGSVTVDFFA